MLMEVVWMCLCSIHYGWMSSVLFTSVTCSLLLSATQMKRRATLVFQNRLMWCWCAVKTAESQNLTALGYNWEVCQRRYKCIIMSLLNRTIIKNTLISKKEDIIMQDLGISSFSSAVPEIKWIKARINIWIPHFISTTILLQLIVSVYWLVMFH